MSAAALKFAAFSQSLSAAVLADAVHTAVDITAVATAYLVVKASLKPPDAEHPYGHQRADAVGGIISSMVMLLSAAIIAYEALHKLVLWEPYAPSLISAALLGTAVAIDVSRAASMSRQKGRSITLRASAAHFVTDAAISLSALAVLLSGIVASAHSAGFLTRWGPAIDAGTALAAACYLALRCAALLRVSVTELLDYMPREIADRACRIAREIPGVRLVKSVRVRKSGSIYHADVVIAVDGHMSVSEAHEIADRVEKALRRELMGDVSVHVEPYDYRQN